MILFVLHNAVQQRVGHSIVVGTCYVYHIKQGGWRKIMTGKPEIKYNFHQPDIGELKINNLSIGEFLKVTVQDG